MKNELTATMTNIIENPNGDEISNALSFIGEKFNGIEALSAKLNKAKEAAEEAQQSVLRSKQRAETIKTEVDSRTNVKVFKKAKAINELQDDVKHITESQIDIINTQSSFAEAQQRANDAQAVSFEIQKQLAKLSEAIVAISVTSLATCSAAIQELERKLNGASKRELTDTAREEIIKIVEQLKSHENMMSRQNKLADIVENQEKANELRDDKIDELIRKGAERDVKLLSLKDIEKREAKQDILIQEGIKKDKEQDAVIQQGVEKDKEQDAMIQKGVDKDKEQDAIIQQGIDKDKEQDEYIRQGVEEDLEQNRKITELTNMCTLYRKEIDELSEKVKILEENNMHDKKMKKISYIFTFAILVLSIIGIII